MSIHNGSTNEDASLTTAMDDGAYCVQHLGDDDITTVLVLSLAEVADVDPLEFQLYEYVDPEALEALYRSMSESDPTGMIALDVLGYRIRIHGSGHIEIVP